MEPLSLQGGGTQPQYKCKFLADLNFYDLTSLAIYMCNDLPTDLQCKDEKNNTVPAMAVADDPREGCITLAPNGKRGSIDHYILDKTKNDGIRIHYSGEEFCDDWRDFDLTIDIKCNPKAETIQDVNVTETHRCFKKVIFTHKAGCKIGQLSALWDWAQRHGWIIAIPFILIGFLKLFIGSKIMKVVYYVCGIITSVCVIWLISYSTFMQTNNHDVLGWIIFGGSVILGIFAGFIFVKFTKIGNFFLGFITGFGTGLLIFNAIVYLVNSYLALWLLTAGLGVAIGGLILFIPEVMKIHCTAFLGGFFLVNGIGMFVGHYQNPFTIIELIRNGEVQSVDSFFYFYLIGCIIFYAIGATYQYRKLQFKRVPRNISIGGKILSIN